MQRAPSRTVSFRLSGSQWQAIDAEARKRKLSIGDFARQVVIDACDKSGEETPTRELLSAVERLRDHFKKAVVAILADAGKCDVADAETWVNANFTP